MNILLIESSPNQKGSSNLLADYFAKGASEKEHQVEVFDAAKSNLHPCLGCGACGMSGPCCQKDDMEQLQKKIMQADMMVFVTPLYYFGFSAQLKMVIDRFYSFTGKLSNKNMKTALIVAAWDSKEQTMADVQAHYKTLCGYMNFGDQGQVLGRGCGTVAMTSKTEFPKIAYELGKSI